MIQWVTVRYSWRQLSNTTQHFKQFYPCGFAYDKPMPYLFLRNSFHAPDEPLPDRDNLLQKTSYLSSKANRSKPENNVPNTVGLTAWEKVLYLFLIAVSLLCEYIINYIIFSALGWKSSFSPRGILLSAWWRDAAGAGCCRVCQAWRWQR